MSLDWYRWAPHVLQSRDGQWRIYRWQVKDSQLFKYELKRRNNGCWMEYGKNYPSAYMAMQAAEDYLETA